MGFYGKQLCAKKVGIFWYKQNYSFVHDMNGKLYKSHFMQSNSTTWFHYIR